MVSNIDGSNVAAHWIKCSEAIPRLAIDSVVGYLERLHCYLVDIMLPDFLVLLATTATQAKKVGQLAPRQRTTRFNRNINN